MRGEMAQFFINERKQFLGGLEVALLDAVQDDRDVAHARRITRNGVRRKLEMTSTETQTAVFARKLEA